MDGQMKGRMDRHGLLYSCLVASVKGYLEDIDFQSDRAEFQGIFFLALSYYSFLSGFTEPPF